MSDDRKSSKNSAKAAGADVPVPHIQKQIVGSFAKCTVPEQVTMQGNPEPQVVMRMGEPILGAPVPHVQELTVESFVNIPGQG